MITLPNEIWFGIFKYLIRTKESRKNVQFLKTITRLRNLRPICDQFLSISNYLLTMMYSIIIPSDWISFKLSIEYWMEGIKVIAIKRYVICDASIKLRQLYYFLDSVMNKEVNPNYQRIWTFCCNQDQNAQVFFNHEIDLKSVKSTQNENDELVCYTSTRMHQSFKYSMPGYWVDCALDSCSYDPYLVRFRLRKEDDYKNNFIFKRMQQNPNNVETSFHQTRF